MIDTAAMIITLTIFVGLYGVVGLLVGMLYNRVLMMLMGTALHSLVIVFWPVSVVLLGYIVLVSSITGLFKY